MRARFLGKIQSPTRATHPPCSPPTAPTGAPSSLRAGRLPIRKCSRTSARSPNTRRSSRSPRTCSGSTFASTRRRPELSQLIEPAPSALRPALHELRAHRFPPGGPRAGTTRAMRVSRCASSWRASPTTCPGCRPGCAWCGRRHAEGRRFARSGSSICHERLQPLQLSRWRSTTSRPVRTSAT